MKFLHAADIHLDSPLAGLLSRDDLPADLLRHATRRAFAAMVDLAIEEDVAFVVIAGDLYDGDWKDFSTGLFFAAEMRRLGRPCFLLRGNHDARSLITRGLKPPPNVREFPDTHCGTFRLDALGVALHGHSFPDRAVPEDLSAGYCPPVAGMVNIGVLHTSGEEGSSDHATYAPCSLAALRAKGYAYWALGHIHARQVLGESPWILFPGNLQGRHPRETGAKGCTLVTVDDGRIAAVEHRSLDVLRWAALEVAVEGADAASLTGLLAEQVGHAVSAGDGRPLLARLTLRGATPLHGTLLGDTAQLAAECRNAALAAGGELWVESVQVRTTPARADLDEALLPLRAAFEAGLGDAELVAALLKDLAALRRRLPAAALAGLDIPEDAAALDRLAEDAWEVAAAAIAAADPR